MAPAPGLQAVSASSTSRVTPSLHSPENAAWLPENLEARMVKAGESVRRYVIALLLGISVASPSTVDAGPSQADVVRFLEQTTFGPTPELMAHVQAVGFDTFLSEQFSLPLPDYPDLGAWPQTPPS